MVTGVATLRPEVARRAISERDALTAARDIASRDHNNLYLTSSFFADRDKYRAFCAYYALMRVVDDRIDALPSRTALREVERRRERRVVAAWRRGVRTCYSSEALPTSVIEACDHPDAELLFRAFADSLARFRPPHTLWVNFFRSMRRDLDGGRFDTWAEFLDYAEGASVAPTTIYLFLITSSRSGTSTSLPVGFDLVECGRQLGLFAYLGHISRDLGEDLRTGEDGLIYLSREDMAAFGVSEERLFSDLERCRASAETRRLVAELLSRAKGFLADGRGSMACLSGQLDKDCVFILELIITLYERVIAKIEAFSSDPMSGAHRLTLDEKRSILKDVARRMAYRPARRHP